MERSESDVFAIMVYTRPGPGVLHRLAEVISDHKANITYVDITDRRGCRGLHLLRVGGGVGSGACWSRTCQQLDIVHLRGGDPLLLEDLRQADNRHRRWRAGGAGGGGSGERGRPPQHPGREDLRGYHSPGGREGDWRLPCGRWPGSPGRRPLVLAGSLDGRRDHRGGAGDPGRRVSWWYL